MLLTDLAVIVLNLTLVVCCSPQKDADGQEKRVIPDKNRAALDAWLERFPNIPKTKDEGRTVVDVDDEVVLRMFPGEHFYGVYFYVDYPRPKTLPEGLKARNLIVLKPDGSVERVKDVKALKSIIEKSLLRAGNEPAARDAASACVRVAEEFYQDGLYTFDAPDIKVTRKGDALVVTGEAHVKSRGTGKVSITATFKPSGEVDGVTIEGRVRPDVRRR